MSYTTIEAFTPVEKDAPANFHGKQLLFVGWDRHLMFYAPMTLCVEPAMTFGALREQALPTLWGRHPDFARIDWSAVQWLASGEPIAPRDDATLAELGLGHKTLLRLRTPGLEGLAGAGY
ncbi:phenol hydroxylase subunit P4 [Derxia gummosa]|uniref:Phenol hydroxylase subunit P4 n=1 Tax=Derxia gummosa DSM 723 TaxID=1121388 RepID=A0A8B6X4B1_9BURK|nr:phenol hydroxylase subunit P4 [Derxia gummosa]